MKPLTRKYLITFLATGLPFAIGMSGFDLAIGHGFVLWKFLFMFVFFGGFMSLVLVGIQRYQLRKAGANQLDKDALNVHQHRELNSFLSKDAVIQLLARDPVFRKMQVSDSGDEIKILTGLSWKSWGETIRLKFSNSGSDEKRIEIASKPRVSTTVVDYGKNKENVDRLEQLILSGSEPKT